MNLDALYSDAPRSSRDIDLTLHLPISSIVHVSLTSEIELEPIGGTGYNDAIKIKTNDFRNVSFAFREDDALDNTVSTDPFGVPSNRNNTIDDILSKSNGSVGTSMKSSKMAALRENGTTRKGAVESIFGGTKSGAHSSVNISSATGKHSQRKHSLSFSQGGHHSAEFPKSSGIIASIESYWARLTRDHVYIVEGLYSEEGPPVHRVYRRLKYHVSYSLINLMKLK